MFDAAKGVVPKGALLIPRTAIAGQSGDDTNSRAGAPEAIGSDEEVFEPMILRQISITTRNPRPFERLFSSARLRAAACRLSGLLR